MSSAAISSKWLPGTTTNGAIPTAWLRWPNWQENRNRAAWQSDSIYAVHRINTFDMNESIVRRPLPVVAISTALVLIAASFLWGAVSGVLFWTDNSGNLNQF